MHQSHYADTKIKPDAIPELIALVESGKISGKIAQSPGKIGFCVWQA
jgi:hypothetical protein